MPENIANNRPEQTGRARAIATFTNGLYRAYIWNTLW